MGKILKLLVVIALLAGGIAAGDWLHARKLAALPSDAEEAPAEAPPRAKGPTISYEFPNQFFVPIVRNGTLRSVMVLGLGLEISEKRLDIVRSREFQLRDALLRRLMMHANTGGFDGNFTSAPHLRLLGEILLEAAQEVAGEDVHAVLIGDISRQEQ